MQSKFFSKRGGVILVLITLVLVGTALYFETRTGEVTITTLDGLTDTQRAEQQAAYKVAQSFVLDVLKAPATAQFEEWRPFIAYKDEATGEYSISSYVDSQNSYGAMLRSNWLIYMNYNGGDINDPANWTVNMFTFDDEVVKS